MLRNPFAETRDIVFIGFDNAYRPVSVVVRLMALVTEPGRTAEFWRESFEQYDVEWCDRDQRCYAILGTEFDDFGGSVANVDVYGRPYYLAPGLTRDDVWCQPGRWPRRFLSYPAGCSAEAIMQVLHEHEPTVNCVTCSDMIPESRLCNHLIYCDACEVYSGSFDGTACRHFSISPSG